MPEALSLDAEGIRVFENGEGVLKLNLVKSECQKSLLVAGISLNFLPQFHNGYTLYSCVDDYE